MTEVEERDTKRVKVMETEVTVAAEKEAQVASNAGVAGEPAAPDAAKETISFKIVYGKITQEVTRELDSTVGDLKKLVEESTRIEPSGQKLLITGKPLKDDSATLRQAGIKSGSKLMLIGTPAAQVAAAKEAPAAAASGKDDWDAGHPSKEPLHKQPQHKKVLEKGRPDDGIPGIKGKQVPLPDEVKMIGGLMNGHGTKVRLTFKEDNQIWISTATHTQKLPYTSIQKIEVHPIEEQEEYSMVALVLGAHSTYWLYWFPSQYTSGLKIRILGLESLL